MRVVSRPIPEDARLVERNGRRVLVIRAGLMAAGVIVLLDRILRHV